MLKNVFKFIHKIKLRLKIKVEKCTKLIEEEDHYNRAFTYVIKMDQAKHFEDVTKYFDSKSKSIKDIPNIVSQLNLFRDSFGVLRVKSKFDRKSCSKICYFPILLSKHSILTKLIIAEVHKKRGHARCYSLLSELRKTFWITHSFSVVKKLLRECITCRRFNICKKKKTQESGNRSRKKM